MLIDPKYKMSGFDLTCLRVIHMTDVILIWHRIPSYTGLRSSMEVK